MTDSAFDPHILAADALVAMDAAYPKVLAHAGVVVRGDRIGAVGELADLRRQFGILPVRRERGVLLPGLVNAHTHLELSYQSAEQLKTPGFTHWVEALIAHYPPPDQIQAVVRDAVRRGAAASLGAGVTTLGDISRHVQITRDELAAGAPSSRRPRVVSFGEVMGLGKRRDRAAAMIAAAAAPIADCTEGTPALLRGISPHAPYTVEGPVLRACLRQAIIQRLPLAMHLAELADETPFLRDLTGTLGRDWPLMQKMDLLDDHIPLMKGGPLRWAQRWGLLLADAREPKPRAFPVLLAHVNYCDHAELAQLAASRAAVAYCPRTHAYFGHPPHRYRDMLAAGVNVCLATDSLASNPDLSVLREARHVWERDRMDAYALLEMITRRAAAALGLDDKVGTLAPGKMADLVLLPINEEGNTIEKIVAEAPAPAAVWIGGQRVS